MRTVDKASWDMILRRLQEPFPVEDLGFKPQVGFGKEAKAQAAAYIDARIVADRLNEVVGPENWSDEYEMVRLKDFIKIDVTPPEAPRWPNGKPKSPIYEHRDAEYGGVKCTLTICGVSKSDVGTTAYTEPVKSAVSDALKRAAVKFGIGRYIYDLGFFMLAHDNKKFTETPKLPEWALPSPKADPDEVIIEKFREASANPENAQKVLEIMQKYSPYASVLEKREVYAALSELSGK